MLIWIAVLGLIGYVFGVRILGGLIITGVVVVGLYLAAVFHLRFQEIDQMRARAAAEAAAEIRATGVDPWKDFTPVPAAPPRPHAEVPSAYVPPRAFNNPLSTSVAVPPVAAAAITAPASPASGWEALPWPQGSADDLDRPAAGPQRLLDRLNRAQLR
jgi:hypothetical protein